MRKCVFLLILTVGVMLLAGCASGAENAPENTEKPAQEMPVLPEKMQVNEQGIPINRCVAKKPEADQ